jgi:protein involved in polysaccharide export with SLBB domain
MIESSRVSSEIDKMIAAYDLKPHPQPAIPDDPPPHEGAMISLPHIVEPPDLILVEVLEALPGRPISGERLVRADGKISLGFYGEIDVRGFTVAQIKVAIIKHLRKYLSDEVLGLISPGPEEAEELVLPGSPKAVKPFPELPKEEESPLERKDQAKPRPSTDRPDSSPRTPKTRPASRRVGRRPIPIQPVRAKRTAVNSQDQEAPAHERNQLKIDAGGKGRVTITIEIDGQGPPAAEKDQPAPTPVAGDEVPWQIVAPEESTHVFVDVTAYNSRNFYVVGDVQTPGKLPWTGNETVLDVLQYAGGLMATAEPKDIRLVRPARGGKPGGVYKVDLAAIQEKGDVTSNYQLFPGDRLIIGRNEVVKKTVELDRLNAPLQGVIGSILQTAFMMRAVQNASPVNSAQLYRDLVEFWAREVSRKGDLKLDEQTLREFLLRELKKDPAPSQTTPTPGPR